MLLPGASKSVILFLLLKLEIASAFVVEPTDVAFLMQAGELIFVVLPSLPVAAITEMFFEIAASIAIAVPKSESSQWELKDPPPRLMLMTVILKIVELYTHQLMPSITFCVVPEPSEPNDLIATMLESGAIPLFVRFVDATMPETCVPWP